MTFILMALAVLAVLTFLLVLDIWSERELKRMRRSRELQRRLHWYVDTSGKPRR